MLHFIAVFGENLLRQIRPQNHSQRPDTLT